MSNIVFLGSPAHGHVNPTLPVVQALGQRGEQVIYYNNEAFRAQIEASGASFRAYPETPISATAITIALGNGNVANIAPLILGATEKLLPFLLSELPREKPDLVIFDSMALWGKMAATSLGVRSVSSISHFIYDIRHLMGEDEHSLRHLWQILPKIPGSLVARIRLSSRYRGLYPEERPLIPLRGGLNILYTARALQPNSSIIDETFRFVGPSINPQSRGEDFPLDAHGSDSVITISLGTVHHRDIAFYRACFAAFGNYPAQFILSAGGQIDLEELGSIPPNFIVRPSIPQLDVLQHTAVFITHGGMNSLHEGLYYGVPLILIPHQLEQLLNARCVEKQGAGLILDKQLTGEGVTAVELRQALEAIVKEGCYREEAKRVQQMLRATGGYNQAADDIQTYLVEARAGSQASPLNPA